MWTLIDYAQNFAGKGNENYIEAIEYIEQYGLPLGTSFALLYGVHTFGAVGVAFRTGKFVVRNREYADRVARVYCPIASLNREVKNTRFLEACAVVCLIPEFDPQRMIEGAEKNQDRLISCGNRNAYFGVMEDIYNYRRRELFPLKIEAHKILRNIEGKRSSKKNTEEEDYYNEEEE